MSERDMQQLLELVERVLGKGWRQLVEDLRDKNSLDAITTRLHSGDVAGAIEGVEDAAKAFAGVQADAYGTSAERAAAWISDASGTEVALDETTAGYWAKKNQLELVRDITDEQRGLLKQIHECGVAEGLNPRAVAREMRDSIGLTPYQSQIVENYRAALESGDYTDALSRELTDGRSDRSVGAAQGNGKQLSQSQIDDMVERYRGNWIDFRAETIARTEGLRVTHQGTEAVFTQAIKSGHVRADQLEREWHHGKNGKDSRDGHRRMNNQRRKYGEKFKNPETGAELAYPGDPDAGAEETIRCVCCVSTRLVA